MKLRRSLFGIVGVVLADQKDALEVAVEGSDVRGSWETGFKTYAQMIMQDTTGQYQTLNDCVQAMSTYFEKIIQDDKTNTYVTLAWCGSDEDSHPDENGNVWWYDGWDTKVGGVGATLMIYFLTVHCSIRVWCHLLREFCL